jgi:hypothetical protein
VSGRTRTRFSHSQGFTSLRSLRAVIAEPGAGRLFGRAASFPGALLISR